tara:strand:- start:1331 stop:1585 length:255 start_codon:yes stop_codon:yes gene_type:complete
MNQKEICWIIGVLFMVAIGSLYYMANHEGAYANENKDTLIEMIDVDGVECVKMRASHAYSSGASITCNWDKFNSEKSWEFLIGK